ncbi:hypothetical protein HDU67_007713 [Dinochytrium kinnereticum]|nr:hypothetical protein HDU67_007713 [Dinochytrium kinnereticum]
MERHIQMRSFDGQTAVYHPVMPQQHHEQHQRSRVQSTISVTGRSSPMSPGSPSSTMFEVDDLNPSEPHPFRSSAPVYKSVVSGTFTPYSSVADSSPTYTTVDGMALDDEDGSNRYASHLSKDSFDTFQGHRQLSSFERLRVHTSASSVYPQPLHGSYHQPPHSHPTVEPYSGRPRALSISSIISTSSSSTSSTSRQSISSKRSSGIRKRTSPRLNRNPSSASVTSILEQDEPDQLEVEEEEGDDPLDEEECMDHDGMDADCSTPKTRKSLKKGKNTPNQPSSKKAIAVSTDEHIMIGEDPLARRRFVTGDSERRFECTFCRQLFVQLVHLKIHMRRHTGERPYQCRHCDRSFNQKGNLKTHERRHTGDKPFKCEFPGCTKSFSQMGNLRTHEKLHQNVKRFSCTLCEKAFSQLGNLKSHITKVHAKIATATATTTTTTFPLPSPPPSVSPTSPPAWPTSSSPRHPGLEAVAFAAEKVVSESTPFMESLSTDEAEAALVLASVYRRGSCGEDAGLGRDGGERWEVEEGVGILTRVRETVLRKGGVGCGV